MNLLFYALFSPIIAAIKMHLIANSQALTYKPLQLSDISGILATLWV
jgi:hypothetical protein